MPTRMVYNNKGKKVKKAISSERSRAAKKGARKRRGKPLSGKHKRNISMALRKSPRARKAAKRRGK